MPPRQAYTEDSSGRLIPIVAGQPLPRVSYGAGPTTAEFTDATAARRGSGNRPRLGGPLAEAIADRSKGSVPDRPFAPFINTERRRSESDSEDGSIVVGETRTAPLVKAATSTAAADPDNAGQNIFEPSQLAKQKARAVEARIVELQQTDVAGPQRSQRGRPAKEMLTSSQGDDTTMFIDLPQHEHVSEDSTVDEVHEQQG